VPQEHQAEGVIAAWFRKHLHGHGFVLQHREQTVRIIGMSAVKQHVHPTHHPSEHFNRKGCHGTFASDRNHSPKLIILQKPLAFCKQCNGADLL
jgi:hypothetical protein